MTIAYIKQKRKSILSTKKIADAMHMVAASKMRKSQLAMSASRPYAAKIQSVIAHLTHASRNEDPHPYMASRTIHRIGYIVISSDRGLCGNLNTSLFRLMLQDAKRSPHVPKIALIGKKLAYLCRSFEIVSHAHGLGDKPSIMQLIGVIKPMFDDFLSGQIDQVCVVYHDFVSTLVQRPRIDVLLPISQESMQSMQELGETDHAEPSFSIKSAWDYLYEPHADLILNILLTRYLESRVYQAVLENIACEQAARMMAMKNASENASDISDELLLIYNKARQALVTKEISEIVSGGEAIQ